MTMVTLPRLARHCWSCCMPDPVPTGGPVELQTVLKVFAAVLAAAAVLAVAAVAVLPPLAPPAGGARFISWAQRRQSCCPREAPARLQPWPSSWIGS